MLICQTLFATFADACSLLLDTGVAVAKIDSLLLETCLPVFITPKEIHLHCCREASPMCQVCQSASFK